MNSNDLSCFDLLQPHMSTNYGMEVLVLARTFVEDTFVTQLTQLVYGDFWKAGAEEHGSFLLTM